MDKLNTIINEEVSSFVNENQNSQYYISAGKGGKLYTLRQTWEEKNGYGEPTVRDYHVATLSKDLETAKQKAKQKLGYVPEVAYTEELGQIKQTKTFEHMPNGKYEGIHFKDVPTEYLLWWKNNYHNTPSYKKIVQAIINHFKEQNLYNEINPINLQNTPPEDINKYIEYARGGENYDNTVKQMGEFVGNNLLLFKKDINALPFGKWKDVPFEDVPRDYLTWMLKNSIERKRIMYSENYNQDFSDEYIFNNGVSEFIKDKPGVLGNEKDMDNFKMIATLYDAIQKQPEPEATKPSEYIGNVGGTVEVDVTVTMVKNIDTQFGSTLLVKMVDAAGNNITTFGNNAFTRSVENGSKAKIVGTVKKQDEFRGEKGTQLVRVKQI